MMHHRASACAEPDAGPASEAAWQPPPRSLALASDRVDVWRVPLEVPESGLVRLEAVLSEGELRRASRFLRRADRDRFVARRGSLRQILARYLGVRPDRLQFETGSFGKPTLASVPLGDRLEFSQTHSEGLSLVALARGRRVGVDVELVRPGANLEVVAGRFFSLGERGALRRIPENRRQRAFLATWVRKEAFLKALGVGLSATLDGFSVSVDPREPAILLDPGEGVEETTYWSLYDLEAWPGWLATLAVEGAGWRLRRWRWE